MMPWTRIGLAVIARCQNSTFQRAEDVEIYEQQLYLVAR